MNYPSKAYKIRLSKSKLRSWSKGCSFSFPNPRKEYFESLCIPLFDNYTCLLSALSDESFLARQKLFTARLGAYMSTRGIVHRMLAWDALKGIPSFKPVSYLPLSDEIGEAALPL